MYCFYMVKPPYIIPCIHSVILHIITDPEAVLYFRINFYVITHVCTFTLSVSWSYACT